MEFETLTVRMEFPNIPFRSEVEYALEKYVDQNNLVRMDSQHVTFFGEYPSPQFQGFRMDVRFLARKKNHDEVFRDQVESLIKRLET